jgi:ribosomal protein S18 acetylase RimI-like enzyme
MITLRNLEKNDLMAVRKIFVPLFDRVEDYNFSESWRHRNFGMSFAAISPNEQVVGFLLFRGKRIEYLAVDPEYQSYGIGSQLLKKVLEECHRYNIRPDLIPIRKVMGWYRRYGFELSGEWNTHPITGEAEPIMIFTGKMNKELISISPFSQKKEEMLILIN